MIKCKNLEKILKQNSLKKLKLTKTGLTKTKMFNKNMKLNKYNKIQNKINKINTSSLIEQIFSLEIMKDLFTGLEIFTITNKIIKVLSILDLNINNNIKIIDITNQNNNIINKHTKCMNKTLQIPLKTKSHKEI